MSTSNEIIQETLNALNARIDGLFKTNKFTGKDCFDNENQRQLFTVYAAMINQARAAAVDEDSFFYRYRASEIDSRRKFVEELLAQYRLKVTTSGNYSYLLLLT